jgi:hypothetical protein
MPAPLDSRVSNVCHAHKELERIHLPNFSLAPLHISLNLALSFLPIRGESKILLVAPKYCRARVLLLSWRERERSARLRLKGVGEFRLPSVGFARPAIDWLRRKWRLTIWA